MNKRIISLCLALALLLCLLPSASLGVTAAGDVAINETNFPDENFRSYVSDNIDLDGNGRLNQSELDKTDGIHVGEAEIQSLKGIEYFTSLMYLECSYNELTTLDVSKNTALISLDCSDNELTALDVSKNAALEELNCSGNELTTLDVSKNTALISLDCSNDLTALEVIKNAALEELNCYKNRLTELNVNGTMALQVLDCEANELTTLDVSKNTSLEKLNCHFNQLTTLDVSKNANLLYLYCSGNKLTALNVNGATSLVELYCMYNKLTTLDVSKNTALEDLYCSGNRLTALDVSRASSLITLNCPYNKLTTLNVSNNTALVELDCSYNDLTDLDVSKNTALKYLNCSDAQLTSLDVSKNVALGELDCDGNELTALDVSENTALMVLYCDRNELTSLDVSRNINLEALNCSGNRLSVLDVSAVPMLLDALEHGEKTCHTDYYTESEFVIYNSEQGSLWIDPDQRTIPARNPFFDITTTKYYYDAVLWAGENGITGGTDATHFSPNATCKREQVMTFLWAAYNKPEPTSDVNPFTDVTAGKYYVKPVLWAVENSITGGMSATTFGVGKACTRAQVVTFLWVAAGRPEPTLTENPFTDIKSSDYYYKAVLWALENGITGGTSATTFGPKNNCTRAQVVTFLYAAVGKE